MLKGFLFPTALHALSWSPMGSTGKTLARLFVENSIEVYHLSRSLVNNPIICTHMR